VSKESSIVECLLCEHWCLPAHCNAAPLSSWLLQDNGVLRLTPADLQAQLPTLLERLFNGFSLPDSSENEYLMRAVTRVIG
jgi:hypothetical protein